MNESGFHTIFGLKKFLKRSNVIFFLTIAANTPSTSYSSTPSPTTTSIPNVCGFPCSCHHHPSTYMPPVDLNQSANSLVPKTPVVELSSGKRIQFGCPPESHKVSMRSGKDVPVIYVLPEPFFQNGVNYGDIEFPIYWYAFVKGWLQKGEKVTLVGTENQLARMKIILQETIFGPTREHLELAGHPPIEIERILRESHYFAVKDRSKNPAIPYPLEAFVDFVPFNHSEVAALNSDKNITVERKGENHFLVRDGLREEIVDLNKTFHNNNEPYDLPQTPFYRPEYGITFLGTSSGFDPHGLTTSLILWSNQKGMLIDPLAYVIKHMESLGISPIDVRDVLLTHVHGDHDAGLISYILAGGKVRLLTSRVIFESFLRKAKAITGQDFETLVDFVELIAGQPFKYESGYTITSRNNFHSIPTIGFRIESPYGSLSYSGDTFYDPEKIKELVKEGILTEHRAAEIDVPQADYVFHEAGIPPIHTPQKPLEVASSERKKTITLVHRPQLKEGEEGLPVAKSGEQIVYKDSIQDPESDCTKTVLSLFPLSHDGEFLRYLKEHAHQIVEQYAPGNLVVSENSKDPDKSMYVIMEGTVDVLMQGKPVARLQRGDYFGERRFLRNVPRTADVRATSTVSLIRLDQRFAGNLDKNTRIAKIADNYLAYHQDIIQVPSFKGMRTDVMRDIISRLNLVEFPRNAVLMKQGEPGNEMYIIKEGELLVEKKGKASFHKSLTRGDLVGEMAVLAPMDYPRQATVTVKSEKAVLLLLTREDIEWLCNKYPGVSFELKRLADSRSAQ